MISVIRKGSYSCSRLYLSVYALISNESTYIRKNYYIYRLNVFVFIASLFRVFFCARCVVFCSMFIYKFLFFPIFIFEILKLFELEFMAFI